MKAHFKVKHGGLMRCCLLTLDDAMVERSDDEPLREGETLACKWCDAGMVYRDAAWQWDDSQRIGHGFDVQF